MSATMTKKAMTEIARQSFRYGHFQRDEWNSWVRCPQCRQDVSAYRPPNGPTWPKAFTAAMLEHLPACTVMLAARDGQDLSGASLQAVSDALDLAPMNSAVSNALRREYDARVA